MGKRFDIENIEDAAAAIRDIASDWGIPLIQWLPEDIESVIDGYQEEDNSPLSDEDKAKLVEATQDTYGWRKTLEEPSEVDWYTIEESVEESATKLGIKWR